ncbi:MULTISPECIES: hypothetical protein [Streptomyces]|uniref:DUF4190 domain-containing protein n=1 Tax=Streptomyces sudanensis TaxID=436397 RepID=A0ABY4TIX1_9ACTN|nr:MULTISPECIES: hypothetical protein [Streptomyces]MCP9958150.1 hypothetical protein [Streptomyces sudanensis]MCP9987259.1 hypothetical protein [Streptomyces sudanensis]MCQ0001329.1 hypothetical protein [Streptomyces sudanensis]URN16930.1 hypothetical protein MW084_14425 [Streptomyces sudanensis]
MSRSVVFGAASVAFWFCCPFWMLVWALALPLGFTGLVLGAVEYRAAARQGVSRAQPLAGLALSSLGTAAAVAYALFVSAHPDLPIQE